MFAVFGCSTLDCPCEVEGVDYVGLSVVVSPGVVGLGQLLEDGSLW